MPLLMAPLGLGGPARILYPVSALGFAFFLYLNSPRFYLGLCLWLFFLTPFVRRFVDLYAGYQPVSPIMIAPYAAASLSGFALLQLCLSGRSRNAIFLLIMFLAIVYGFMLAAINGRLVSGGFEALRWAVPLCMVAYILQHRHQLSDFYRTLLTCFFYALPLLGIYGIIQYIAPPPWDTHWMNYASLSVAGLPEPFKVRVYSTMNNPGVLSLVIMAGLLLSLTRLSPLVILFYVPAMVTFLLTMQRMSYVALFLATACLLTYSLPHVRVRVILATIAVAGVVAVMAVLPVTGEMVADRLMSFFTLGEDDSANSRLRQYVELLAVLEGDLLGRGFDWTGAYARLVGDTRGAFAADGGIIFIFVGLGVPVATIYLIGLSALWWQTMVSAARSTDAQVHASAAVVFAGFATLPLGSNHMAEHGFFIWLFAGLALAALENARPSAGEKVHALQPMPLQLPTRFSREHKHAE